jgi:FMN phosphatase YigB (HAD superfamily)
VPNAVLFDLFETLVTEPATRPRGAASLGPELGCDREAFRTRWKALRPNVLVGRLSFCEAIAAIAVELGQRPSDARLLGICEERSRVKANVFEQIEPEVLGMVRELRRRGLRLGVISNCFAEDVASWPSCSLARHVDCSVFSFRIGVAKPESRIHAEAAHSLGVDVADAWYVGDGMHDELEGAERAGLRAFRALWFLQRWPHYRITPSPTAQLTRVEDVVSLVEQST